MDYNQPLLSQGTVLVYASHRFVALREGIVKDMAPAGSLLHPVESREAYIHCGVHTVLPALVHHNQLQHPFV